MRNPYTIAKRCKLAKGFLPSFTPQIYFLPITDTSAAGAYSYVIINGNNFLPNGSTYVNFGNDYTNIPVSYFSSNNISFIVPGNATPGIYNIVVVNNYTGNFGSHINNFYNSNLNYSNSVPYTLT
jgi:hypothetical protein